MIDFSKCTSMQTILICVLVISVKNQCSNSVAVVTFRTAMVQKRYSWIQQASFIGSTLSCFYAAVEVLLYARAYPILRMIIREVGGWLGLQEVLSVWVLRHCLLLQMMQMSDTF